MWIPDTEDEILAAIAAGKLHETAIFEAKRQLPDKSRNIDVAIDVAAMSTDGGVIIYGLDEDANHFITTPTPIPLAGTRERISSIIQTSVSEVPAVTIKPIQSTNDPSSGYIVLIVPTSARAPHMVIVKGDHRFYGRTDTGNRLLSEAEVARLYQRRMSIEIDFNLHLRKELETAPIPLDDERGHLFLLAQPMLSTRSFLDDALGASSTSKDLLNQIVGAAIALPVATTWAPTINYLGNWHRVVEGFQSKDEGIRPKSRLDMRFDFSGAVHLFCGRGADTINGTKVVFSQLLAGLTMQFVYMTGKFCESAGYLGNVNLGILLTGIKGSTLHQGERGWHSFDFEPVPRGEYMYTTNAAASALIAEYQKLSSELVMPLVAEMSREQDNPFVVLLRNQKR